MNLENELLSLKIGYLKINWRSGEILKFQNEEVISDKNHHTYKVTWSEKFQCVLSVGATMTTYQKIITDRLYSNNGRAKRQLRSAPLSPFHNLHQNKKHGLGKAFSDFLVEEGGCGIKYDVIRCHAWNPDHTLSKLRKTSYMANVPEGNSVTPIFLCLITLLASTFRVMKTWNKSCGVMLF